MCQRCSRVAFRSLRCVPGEPFVKRYRWSIRRRRGSSHMSAWQSHCGTLIGSIYPRCKLLRQKVRADAHKSYYLGNCDCVGRSGDRQRPERDRSLTLVVRVFRRGYWHIEPKNDRGGSFLPPPRHYGLPTRHGKGLIFPDSNRPQGTSHPLSLRIRGFNDSPISGVYSPTREHSLSERSPSSAGGGIMRYRLPQTHSPLISISIEPIRRIAEFSLGNAPALRTRLLISRFTRSSILVVQIRLQCSSGSAR